MLTKLKEFNFINNFELNIAFNCLEKPKCIVSESLRPNSAYYYLLLKELKSSFFNNDSFTFDSFIGEKTKIYFKSCTGNAKNILDDIESHIDQNRYIILAGDLFFEEENERRFRSDHHIHYWPLKGYDKASNSYIIIDEDYSSNTFDFMPDKRISGMHYIEKYKSANRLKDFCCNVHLAENSADTSYYRYYKAEFNPSDIISCKISDIVDQYENLLTTLVDKSGEYEEYLLFSMNFFITNLKPIYSKLVSEFLACDKDDPRTAKYRVLPKDIAFPFELYPLFIHYYSLKAQQKVFSLKLKDSEEKNNIDNYFKGLLKKYNIMFELARKSLLTGKIKYSQRIIPNHLNGISSQETELYKYILGYIKKITNDFQSASAI